MTSPKRSQGSKPSATEQSDRPTDLIVSCADEGSESRAVRRGRPSAAEAEQIVGRILEASWEVLLAEGFEGFTFDRVARHAHIGKATIYSRFANKRELMGALLRHRIEAQHAHITAMGAGLPPMEAFIARSTEVLSLLLSPDGILQERLIDWMDQEGDGECGEIRNAIYRHSLVAIEALIHQANATGLIHIPDPARQPNSGWKDLSAMRASRAPRKTGIGPRTNAGRANMSISSFPGSQPSPRTPALPTPRLAFSGLGSAHRGQSSGTVPAARRPRHRHRQSVFPLAGSDRHRAAEYPARRR